MGKYWLLWLYIRYSLVSYGYIFVAVTSLWHFYKETSNNIETNRCALKTSSSPFWHFTAHTTPCFRVRRTGKKCGGLTKSLVMNQILYKRTNQVNTIPTCCGGFFREYRIIYTLWGISPIASFWLGRLYNKASS